MPSVRAMGRKCVVGMAFMLAQARACLPALNCSTWIGWQITQSEAARGGSAEDSQAASDSRSSLPFFNKLTPHFITQQHVHDNRHDVEFALQEVLVAINGLQLYPSPNVQISPNRVV